MKKFLILMMLAVPIALFAATANVTVDYTSEINGFSPGAAFSINTGEWDGYALLKANIWKFQHAGFKYIRFPGGSNSNEYHWNGDGYYDSDKIWHVTGSPNPTTFSKGFVNLSVYRGSTSAGYRKKAFVTDTSLSTSWKSFEGEASPQWIYLDIQSASYNPVSVNRIVIEWGASYAAQYKIQYSTANWPGGLGQWALNDTAWKDTSSGTITGAGGQEEKTFTTVSAKYIRVLCLAPSSGTQYEIKGIKLYSGTTEVTVTSDDPMLQTKSVSSSVSLGDNKERNGNMDFEQFMSICRSLTPPAEPLITVNFFTGTTQEAKDWVTYSVNKGYNIKYWEIGNENAGNWESGGPVSPEFYAKRYIDFYDAMIAADPSITIIPQFNCISDPWNVSVDAGGNSTTGEYYIEAFLKYLQAQGRSSIIKSISVHRYPTWQPKAEATPLAASEIWNTEMTPLNNWIDTYCGGPSNTKIWLTEYNEGIDSAFTNNYYNSLFISTYLLNYLRNGGDFGFFFTDFGTPGPGQMDPNIFSDFGAIEGGGLSGQYAKYRYQPRSSFWAMWMLNNRFSAADSLGNTLVTASSSDSSLKVFANKRGDRKLSVILINTSNTAAVDANISLNGFTPLSSADVTTYSPQQYSWILSGAASHADPDLQPPDSVTNSAAASFSVSVPAYNIKIITMYDQAQATFSPSETPTQLPTPTTSPTPPVAGGTMLEDCEDGDSINLWNGPWLVYGDNISVYPSVIDSMACGGSFDNSCFMKITGTVTAGTGVWGFGVNCPLSSTWASIDISMYDGLFFWYKGDGKSVRMQVNQRDTPNYDYYGNDFISNTFWTYYQLPFSTLTQPTWNSMTWVFDLLVAQAVSFQTSNSTHAVYMGIDNVGFYKNTPTITPTPVASAPDLKKVKVYPQPCDMHKKACKGFTFANLTAHTKLKIFTMDGGLVFKMDEDTPDGTYFWDLASRRKAEAIAPGLYLYIIVNEKKEVARGRLTIIR